jgi:hypothetical protein
MAWPGLLNSALHWHFRDKRSPDSHGSKKSKVQNQGLAAAILQGLMPVTTEPEPEDSDEDAPCRVSVGISGAPFDS